MSNQGGPDNGPKKEVEIKVSQSMNSLVVSNGSFLIALQTAMRSAIIEYGKSESDLTALAKKIKRDVKNATAGGFTPQEELDGKKRVLDFVAVIEDAIRRELAHR